MFCPKCGNQFAGEETLCSNCGYEIEEREKITQSESIKVPKTEIFNNKIIDIQSIKVVCFPVLGVIVLIMCFIAAHKIAVSGLEIMSIQSVAGTSLDEAYYYQLGGIYAGYAMIARTIGIFFASVLVWLGLKK